MHSHIWNLYISLVSFLSSSLPRMYFHCVQWKFDVSLWTLFFSLYINYIYPILLKSCQISIFKTLMSHKQSAASVQIFLLSHFHTKADSKFISSCPHTLRQRHHPAIPLSEAFQSCWCCKPDLSTPSMQSTWTHTHLNPIELFLFGLFFLCLNVSVTSSWCQPTWILFLFCTILLKKPNQ